MSVGRELPNVATSWRLGARKCHGRRVVGAGSGVATVGEVTAPELFDDPEMAAGYAHDRPPVHAQLMDRLRASRAWNGPVRRVVDVGCGAGASSAALRDMADTVVGVDPYPAMVGTAAATVDAVSFGVARAEALPFAAATVGVLAAAGSLNYADLDAFVVEADRVLAATGIVAVTNYSFGRPTDPTVAPSWPARFAARWPRPTSAPVVASSFVSGPFRVVVDDAFTVAVPMTFTAYLAYVMTETNVAQAVAGGAAPDDVRAWCAGELGSGYGSEQPIAFDCSLLVLRR